MTEIPNVLAQRYASAQMVALWSPEHKVRLERDLWIARDDFLEEPPPKFFRLAPGREVRLVLLACLVGGAGWWQVRRRSTSRWPAP